MKYLFDTDVISGLLRGGPLMKLQQRFARLPLRDQFTTAITLGELSYGAHRAGRLDLYAKARLILDDLEILPFDAAAAEEYGPMRARTEARGVRLDEADLRIACIALVHDCTLVTGNVRHFAEVDGLRVEDWVRS